MTSKSKGKPKREARTKEMLLPLTARIARDISLENHLALATMRAGRGTSDTMVALVRLLYMLYFILDTACAEIDVAQFLKVEAVLDESIRAEAQGSGWKLPMDKMPTVEWVLQRFDEVVVSMPKNCYVEAWDKLNRFVNSTQPSPLPGSQAGRIWGE